MEREERESGKQEREEKREVGGQRWMRGEKRRGEG